MPPPKCQKIVGNVEKKICKKIWEKNVEKNLEKKSLKNCKKGFSRYLCERKFRNYSSSNQSVEHCNL